MATHSSVLAWRIPGTGEPGGLPSMGLHRVGHYWSDLAAAAAAGINGWWILSNSFFLCILKWSYGFLYSAKAMNFIDSFINHTWCWFIIHIILFIARFGLLVFCLDFLHLYLWEDYTIIFLYYPYQIFISKLR